MTEKKGKKKKTYIYHHLFFLSFTFGSFKYIKHVISRGYLFPESVVLYTCNEPFSLP